MRAEGERFVPGRAAPACPPLAPVLRLRRPRPRLPDAPTSERLVFLRCRQRQARPARTGGQQGTVPPTGQRHCCEVGDLGSAAWGLRAAERQRGWSACVSQGAELEPPIILCHRRVMRSATRLRRQPSRTSGSIPTAVHATCGKEGRGVSAYAGGRSATRCSPPSLSHTPQPPAVPAQLPSHPFSQLRGAAVRYTR